MSKGRGVRLRVDAVLVPPMQTGTAFAHTPEGRCVTFTGPRERMIQLCRDHREHNLGLRPPVFVDAKEWDQVKAVSGSDDCWIHHFVAAGESAA